MIELLRPFFPPAAILAIAAVAASLGPPLPPTLSGLRTAGPYAVLIAAIAVAWWFNRGRAVVLGASLLAAFAAYDLYPTEAVYAALTVLVPLNALLATIFAERGARYRAYRWLALLAAEAAFVVLVVKNLPAPEHWALRSPPAPLVGRVAFAVAFVAAVWRAWPERRPLHVGNVAALAAYFIAAESAGSPGAYTAFMCAAGAVLIVALLQESQQLAFRDQLTGLAARRALEERLRTLRAPYTVAMVDVDHFKAINDTHGHAVGDQVLKVVGARLAEVGGGGIAYRYGGEEFSLLFPGRTLDEASPHLEAMRASIERYRMAVRGDDRPRSAEEGSKLRAERRADKTLSVTVSIGAAEPSASTRTPRHVVHAADEALYRAKQAGRNRLSR